MKMSRKQLLFIIANTLINPLMWVYVAWRVYTELVAHTLIAIIALVIWEYRNKTSPKYHSYTSARVSALEKMDLDTPEMWREGRHILGGILLGIIIAGYSFWWMFANY